MVKRKKRRNEVGSAAWARALIFMERYRKPYEFDGLAWAVANRLRYVKGYGAAVVGLMEAVIERTEARGSKVDRHRKTDARRTRKRLGYRIAA